MYFRRSEDERFVVELRDVLVVSELHVKHTNWKLCCSRNPSQVFSNTKNSEIFSKNLNAICKWNEHQEMQRIMSKNLCIDNFKKKL